MPNGDIDLGALAIVMAFCTWTDVEQVSVGFYNFYLKLVSQKVLKISIRKMSLKNYSQTSYISCTFVGNIIAHHSVVVGASPVCSAPTTSSFLT